VITATQAPEKYLEIFDQFNNRAGAGQPRWLQSLRQDAFARFSETGFPTTHDEDWRFTNVAPLANTPFGLASLETVSREQLDLFGISQFACRLVFVNGLFSQELSNVATLPKGVTASSPFGEYRSEYSQEGRLLRIAFRGVGGKGVYPKEKLPELQAWLNALAEDNLTSVVVSIPPM